MKEPPQLDRRGFLQCLGIAVAGLALEQAIPLGRVWSFPSKIVLPHAVIDTIVGTPTGYTWVAPIYGQNGGLSKGLALCPPGFGFEIELAKLKDLEARGLIQRFDNTWVKRSNCGAYLGGGE